MMMVIGLNALGRGVGCVECCSLLLSLPSLPCDGLSRETLELMLFFPSLWASLITDFVGYFFECHID